MSSQNNKNVWESAFLGIVCWATFMFIGYGLFQNYPLGAERAIGNLSFFFIGLGFFILGLGGTFKNEPFTK